MPKGQPLPPNEDADNPLYKQDEFRMWALKVLPCSKRYVHDWTTCPWAHAQEKAKRRDPRVFQYCAVACDSMKKTMTCPRGDQCPYAHNVFEYWLHHTRYRTQLCNDGVGCKRKICFFAHTLDELRVSNVKLPDGVRNSVDLQQPGNNNVNPFAPSPPSARAAGGKPQQGSPEHHGGVHHAHSGSLGSSVATTHDAPFRSNSGLDSLTGGSVTPLSSAGRSSTASGTLGSNNHNHMGGAGGLSLAELQQLGALHARIQAQQQQQLAAAAYGQAAAADLAGSPDALLQLMMLAQQQQQQQQAAAAAADPALVQQILAHMLLAGQQQQQQQQQAAAVAQLQQQMALIQLLGQQQMQQQQQGAGDAAAFAALAAQMAAQIQQQQQGAGDVAAMQAAAAAAAAMAANSGMMPTPAPTGSGRFPAAPGPAAQPMPIVSAQQQMSLPLPYNNGGVGRSPLVDSQSYDPASAAAAAAMEELTRQLSMSGLGESVNPSPPFAAMGARLQLSPRHTPTASAPLLGADPMVSGAPRGYGAIGSGGHSPPGSNRSSASAGAVNVPARAGGGVGALGLKDEGLGGLPMGAPPACQTLPGAYAPFGGVIGAAAGGKPAPAAMVGSAPVAGGGGAVAGAVMVPQRAQHISPVSVSALGECGATATTGTSFFTQRTHSLGSSRDGSDSLDVGTGGILHH